MKILCLGDSNTYGYNPCSPLGDRYPKLKRWTGILNEDPRWEMINAGENGREIPFRDWELERTDSMLSWSRPDAVIVMLGTNDLLEGVTPGQALTRMEAFLRRILNWGIRPDRLLLATPPRMSRGLWVTNPELPRKVDEVSAGYAELARRLGLHYVDTTPWPTTLTFDGVHLTAEGHEVMAREMGSVLKRCFLS